MTSYRLSRVVTYNHANGKNGGWIITNGHIDLINKSNQQIVPIITQHFSWNDYATNKHSRERAKLFHENIILKYLIYII
jgi:hypothetical protein